MTTCPAPDCGADVIPASTPSGQVLLQPRPVKSGTWAARQSRDGSWKARYVTREMPLAPGEERHADHRPRCRGGGRDAWVKAVSANAAATRTQRGRYRPRHKGPRVGGMRLMPGGERK